MEQTFELYGHERFAAYVAHELRTPLAVQCALLELALTDAGTDSAAWREIGEDLLRAGRQQERLLEACLTLARSRGSLQRRVPVDLRAVAAGVLSVRDAGELELVPSLEPARTSGDPVLVERLVDNLVSNAIRHNVAHGRVEVGTRTEAGRSVLTVANTGPYVPPGDVQRLFRPFQRRAASRAFGDGVGLGLAIVRSIADAHGARVTVRALIDGGLAVGVAFPASA